MPSDNKFVDPERPESPASKKNRAVSSNMALALELPFTFVGAIAVGAVMGYFVDRWLHTKIVFAVLLGALGFFAGLREILRRLPGPNDGTAGK